MTQAVKYKDSELVAKRWAKALIELAQENEGISKEDILDDLKEVAKTINESSELSVVIDNPSITDEKQIVMQKLFQNNVMPIVYNFLFALGLKKRLNIIPAIAEEFEKELENIKNIVKVTITSAIDINSEKKEYIISKLAEKLHKQVNVEWGVDTEIIAGLIFNINETILDNSVKHKLDDLSKNIGINI